jgi:signal transduction histidine kinase
MGLVEYIYPESPRSAEQTFLTGVISTSKQTIAGIVAIFNSLWEETELRQEAELMQDILTHDIRNYNQISMSNAEMLRESLHGDHELSRLADSILGAVDGSTELIRKTKMLASIIASKQASLEPVNLRESFERSLSLVRSASPDKVIELSTQDFPETTVIADSLLDEVFVNILTNSVNYTSGRTVPLRVEVEVDEGGVAAGGSPKGSFYKISVADHGRGIPDEMKASVGMRYLGTSKIGGLGLSIVRALVVDRYSGKIEIKDRVKGDYAKGTRVEIWLPKK